MFLLIQLMLSLPQCVLVIWIAEAGDKWEWKSEEFLRERMKEREEIKNGGEYLSPT